MTIRTLREILEEASRALATHGDKADISEARARLNEIVVATTKNGDISRDRFISLEIRHGMVFYVTEHDYDGELQDDMRNFPQTVLDADDPVRAAREWTFASRLKLARSMVDTSRREMEFYQSALDKLYGEYELFRAEVDTADTPPKLD